MTDSLHVLYVDDDPGALRTATNYFERFHDDINIETVSDPTDVVDRLSETAFACVLSDYEMPQLDGLELLESIREAGESLPFVLYTGQGDEGIASEALEAGVTDYVEKDGGRDHFAVLANRIENAARYHTARAQTDRGTDAGPTSAQAEAATAREDGPGHHHTIVETMRDAAFTVDGTGEVTFVNERFVEATGTEDAALVGRSVEAFATAWLDPDGVDTFTATVRAVIDGEQEEIVEVTAPRAERRDRVVELRVTARADETSGAVGVARDITDRQAQQRELERKTRALEEAPVGLTITDPTRPDNPIVYANPAFERMTGYDTDWVCGRNCRFLQGEGTDEATVARLREAIAAEDSVSVTIRNYRKDGTPFWNLLDVSPVRDDAGEVSNFVGYQQDVTARVELEGRLRDLNETARELMGADDDRAIAEAAVETAGDVLGLSSAVVWTNSTERLQPLVRSGRAETEGAASTDAGAREAFERGEFLTTAEMEVATGSVMAAPLDGFGVLATAAPDDGAFDDNDVELFRILALHVESALARARRNQELERYEAVFNTLDDGVYALDEEGHYEVVNEAMTTLTGYDRATLLDSSPQRIRDGTGAGDPVDPRQHLLEGDQRETTVEFPLETAEGEVVQSEDHATLVENDRVDADIVGVLRDITARKDRREKLSALVETTRQLMSARDREQVIDTALGAARGVLGFEMAAFRLHDPETDRLETVAQIPRPSDGELRPGYDVGEPPTGQAFAEGTTMVENHIEAEEAVAGSGMFVVIGDHGTLSIGATETGAFDDLDRQVADVLAASTATALDRVDREQELREAQAFAEGLIDSVPDIMYVVDRETQAFVRWNDRLKEVTGYNRLELDQIDALDILSAEGRPVAAQAMGRVFDGERQRIEAELETKAGETIPYEFTGSPVTRDGEVEALVGIGRDISERVARERELRRERDRLEQFASTVSHDLRNPLRIAKSNAEMASHESENELLDAVTAAHERMEELIDDLLALARQGQAIDETEPVPVAAVAETAAESVEAPAATVDIDADATVEADDSRLRQLFENLFRNAVEHGTDDVTIRVGDTDEGVFVADDGPGIPEDERAAVFEYGYSTADTGTGLGLAIVTEVVEAHGWTVSVTESQWGGARFDIVTRRQ